MLRTLLSVSVNVPTDDRTAHQTYIRGIGDERVDRSMTPVNEDGIDVSLIDCTEPMSYVVV
jgi:hypothetical protein